MKLCISNGTVINPSTNFMATCDVWIENQHIKEINLTDKIYTPQNGEDVKVIDATDKWVVPGLVDLHVHLREPGFEHKEDIASGCLAAAKGGFTTICCMPNTNPVIDSKEIVELINSKAALANGVEVLAVGAITKGQNGEVIADYESMLSAKPIGIWGISDDGKSVMNSKVMYEAMKAAKEFNLTVFSHAEDENLKTEALSEEIIVARDILLAKATGCDLHFCHISTRDSVELIKWAKFNGINITAETAPHYFTLDKSFENNQTNRKMNPPLRTEKDKRAIIQALKDDIIDIIATDHAPHAEYEKNVSFEKAPFGVIGLETAFSISYTKLVKTGALTPIELINKMSTIPARILGIKRGKIELDALADIAIIDVKNPYTICGEDFVSKSKNSPFVGETVYGKVECTIRKGNVIYDRQLD